MSLVFISVFIFSSILCLCNARCLEPVVHRTDGAFIDKFVDSTVVVSGKVVGTRFDASRSMFGHRAYIAEVMIYCVYKGQATPTRINVSHVGEYQGNCPAIHLRLGHEYMIMLDWTEQDGYFVRYVPELYNYITINQIIQFCGIDIKPPKGNTRMTCAAVKEAENCATTQAMPPSTTLTTTKTVTPSPTPNTTITAAAASTVATYEATVAPSTSTTSSTFIPFTEPQETPHHEKSAMDTDSTSAPVSTPSQHVETPLDRTPDDVTDDSEPTAIVEVKLLETTITNEGKTAGNIDEKPTDKPYKVKQRKDATEVHTPAVNRQIQDTTDEDDTHEKKQVISHKVQSVDASSAVMTSLHFLSVTVTTLTAISLTSAFSSFA